MAPPWHRYDAPFVAARSTPSCTSAMVPLQPFVIHVLGAPVMRLHRLTPYLIYFSSHHRLRLLTVLVPPLIYSIASSQLKTPAQGFLHHGEGPFFIFTRRGTT
jgi:hypothetical protein